jgi:hypothetical protein
MRRNCLFAGTMEVARAHIESEETDRRRQEKFLKAWNGQGQSFLF